jgi:C4-dicarboxylate-specific signal transduction histidine kinase
VPGRLVLVDDEPVILNLLASVLEGDDFDVVPCADGRTGLAEIERGCDVLLTDKNLPDVNGIELLRRARELHPDCEGIIITGYASLDTALAAMQLDAFDYIVKPPKDIFEVQRKVRQAFDRVRMRRENQRLLAALAAQNAELQETLQRLREAQDELIQSEKLAGIGTLAAGIAHEVASPLFGVLGLAEAIVVEERRDLVDGYAREIVDYARSIREIVGQLTGYSRSAGAEGHTTVELRRVAEDAVRLVARSLGFDPSRVRVEGPSDLHVVARTTEISQVFVNLVKNAVEAVHERHGGAGGQVTVALRREERHVVVAVEDDGVGIPADKVPLVFDPFFTTKPPGRGTGLGLNIVYRIATRYRGTVSVDSQEGVGTRISVRIPVEGDGTGD